MTLAQLIAQMRVERAQAAAYVHIRPKGKALAPIGTSAYQFALGEKYLCRIGFMTTPKWLARPSPR